jgi:hypothetical protein
MSGEHNCCDKLCTCTGSVANTLFSAKACHSDALNSILILKQISMNQESVMKRTTTDFGLPTLEEVEEISNSNKKAPDFREDQAFIIHSLKDFDDQIQKHKTETYVLAESLNKLYVENPKFRLMFLRANNFDKAAATCRLMEFLDQKLTYFGKDRLTKEITLNDLSTEDMKALESGMFQELSSLDVIGRPIVALFQQLRRFDKPKNMVSCRKTKRLLINR